MRSPKYDFEGCFGKKWLPFKKISKNCGFTVQTRSKKSIKSVFFWFVICVIKITDPIWNFLQIYIPFSEFFLENMTLIRGTPPCTSHLEVPPGFGFIFYETIKLEPQRIIVRDIIKNSFKANRRFNYLVTLTNPTAQKCES